MILPINKLDQDFSPKTLCAWIKSMYEFDRHRSHTDTNEIIVAIPK